MLSGAGFGSLVALPLQRAARDRGASVFVDAALEPYTDQWAALEAMTPIVAGSLEALVRRVEDGLRRPRCRLPIPSRDAAPWRRRPGASAPIAPETLPASVAVTLADGLYVAQ